MAGDPIKRQQALEALEGAREAYRRRQDHGAQHCLALGAGSMRCGDMRQLMDEESAAQIALFDAVELYLRS